MPFRAAIDMMFLGAHGVDAIFIPRNGEPQADPIRVILGQPDIVTPVYDVPVVSASIQVEVRVSDVPALAAGDVLTLADGAALTISGKPRRDDTRLVWVAGAVEG